MTGLCDFEELDRKQWTWFPVRTGAKRRRVRCPKCNKRLRLRTIPDRQDGGVAFYRIPPHKVTLQRRRRTQLKLPGIR
jgi:hypothetical protein